MAKFWNWIGNSSADPTKLALTVKGLLASYIPLILMFVHNPNLNTLPDDVYSLIVALFGVYSAFAVVVGLVRKLYNTFKPQPVQS